MQTFLIYTMHLCTLTFVKYIDIFLRAKVENVALIPGLEWVAEIHGGAWKSLINGYLPVVALLGLICVLPFLFNWVATSYEKRKTLSGVQNSIVGRYFYYQLANIYITVSAGAIWTSLADIIDHPQQLLVILGETLPKLAGYFISLLITKTLAGLPIVLCRLGALSRMMFLRSCFNKRRLTQRELKEVYRKQPIYYGWEYPTQFLVIIICFTYACITPFVLFFGSAYFFAALLVYKKQALYVYTPTYESGGRMFPQAVSKTLFALLISQLTFIGYSLIRKAVFQVRAYNICTRMHLSRCKSNLLFASLPQPDHIVSSATFPDCILSCLHSRSLCGTKQES